MHRRHSAVLTAAAALLTAGTAAVATLAPVAGSATTSLPAIHHVFVIVLENESSTSTFGDPAADPYLATTLRSEGAYLENYYATGHVSNDNYISMISGQAPNPQNQGDCQIYDTFVGTGPVAQLNGQAVGTGCVYPASVPTIADQLGAHLSWKGYMEDMGNDPSRESATCGHPQVDTQDKTQAAVAGDGYVTRHDPFVYFSSITGDAQYCDTHVVPLGTSSGTMPAGTPPGTTGLASDLASIATTPSLSFIVPDVCDDGHDFPCTNEPTPSTSALGDVDSWLETWVHLITSSPAFTQDGGLLLITFDEAATPPNGDSSSCCNEMPGPDSPLPGITGPGGGKVGALALSPYITPGTLVTTAYNHYAMLGSLEDLFSLDRLGFAAAVPATFGSDVYTNPAGTTTFPAS